MEENLEQVCSFTENLKNMARDINNELDKQNKTIDRINNKVKDLLMTRFLTKFINIKMYKEIYRTFSCFQICSFKP